MNSSPAKTRSRVTVVTVAAAAIFLGAGGLSGQLINDYGGARGTIEWVLRTLVVLAAATLIVGGLTLVLRTRRLLRSRLLGWLVATVAFVATVWFAALPIGFGVYLTHLPSRRAVHDVKIGISKHDVTITGADGVRLSGWYVPSRNGAVVVALHGTGSNRLGVERQARLLARHGYGVLALDLRGHGDSRGRSTSAPWTMNADIGAAIRWVQGRADVDRNKVALLGVSMGAEVAIRAAASEKTVRAVVAEGLNGGAADAKAAGQPWLAVAQLAVLGATTSLLTGQGPGSDSEYLERIRPRPVLLISSGTDSEADANQVFLHRAGRGARLWNLPNASHASAIRTNPAGYESHVISFLDRVLRERDPR